MKESMRNEVHLNFKPIQFKLERNFQAYARYIENSRVVRSNDNEETKRCLNEIAIKVDSLSQTIEKVNFQLKFQYQQKFSNLLKAKSHQNQR